MGRARLFCAPFPARVRRAQARTRIHSRARTKTGSHRWRKRISDCVAFRRISDHRSFSTVVLVLTPAQTLYSRLYSRWATQHRDGPWRGLAIGFKRDQSDPEYKETVESDKPAHTASNTAANTASNMASNAASFFVVDLFDTMLWEHIESAVSSCLISSAAHVNTARLAQEPLLLAQLCFRRAWLAVFGIASSRYDFQAFLTFHGFPSRPFDFGSAQARAAITTEVIGFCRSRTIAALYDAAALEREVTPVVEKHLVGVMGNFDAVRVELVAKWTDRFLDEEIRVQQRWLSMPLPQAYHEIAALQKDNDDCAERDLTLNPVTGMCLEEDETTAASKAVCLWTPNESVRYVLTRDVHFARMLIGKAGIIDAGLASLLAAVNQSDDAILDMSNFPPRVLRNLPSVCLGFCLRTTEACFHSTRALTRDPARTYTVALTRRTKTSNKNRDDDVTDTPDIDFCRFGHPATTRWMAQLAGHVLRRWVAKDASPQERAFLSFLVSDAAPRVAEGLFTLPAKSERSVVMIDSRCNILSALSVAVALVNLRPGEWSVDVYTSNEGLEYYTRVFEEMLGPQNASRARMHVPKCMATCTRFTRDAYNAFLKSPDLWGSLAAREVLTVQDDGFLLRPGLEALVCDKYDYAGAPWARCSANADLERLANTDLVGNGGLSFRNVSAMHRIALEDDALGRRLFLANSTPLPEDVFFAGRVAARALRLCPRDVASKFSVEQVMNLGALGLHRFWAYHGLEACKQLLQNMASEKKNGMKT